MAKKKWILEVEISFEITPNIAMAGTTLRES